VPARSRQPPSKLTQTSTGLLLAALRAQQAGLPPSRHQEARRRQRQVNNQIINSATWSLAEVIGEDRYDEDQHKQEVQPEDP
jgi:lambda repressor-like predicted transcriptional regulator